jgi:electron transfer flavoprotein alpha subunit
MLLVVVEHDRGTLAPASLEALTFARSLGRDVHALTIGAAADGCTSELGEYGALEVHQAHHDLLADYGPEAWGTTVAHAVRALAPTAVLACGTDRGNEVLAQAASRLDLPFAANCTAIELGAPCTLTRLRWGGSLIEHATLDAETPIVSIALHAVDSVKAMTPIAAAANEFTPELPATVARTIVRERVDRAAGLTLATAPVVVGGGRGVGSAEGFAPLQELASQLGGMVGCSRAVTNNGWRNHTDQVGQTGTRIAPDIYFACGISGAIQHWVGAMASKHILAINIDPDANMVVKADSAVIGDLHEVIPAIAAELRRRGGRDRPVSRA